MCDYSLQAKKSRPAVVSDKLVTKNFGSGTTGFCSVDGDQDTVVCVLPGSELAFDAEPTTNGWFMSLAVWRAKHKVAIFRQVNKDNLHAHHDALEFPDGDTKLLTSIAEGFHATVLQLPAAPKTEAEKLEQTRLVTVA